MFSFFEGGHHQKQLRTFILTYSATIGNWMADVTWEHVRQDWTMQTWLFWSVGATRATFSFWFHTAQTYYGACARGHRGVLSPFNDSRSELEHIRGNETSFDITTPGEWESECVPTSSFLSEVWAGADRGHYLVTLGLSSRNPCTHMQSL